MKVLEILTPDLSTEIKRPLFLSNVSAGFPSPAEEYIEKRLDLNQYLIKHPSATYFVRAVGDSMVGAGIHSGDLLIVDRALEPKDKSVIIASLNGELTVKRFRNMNGKIYLIPENKNYSPIQIDEESDFEIWGIVTNVIHSL